MNATLPLLLVAAALLAVSASAQTRAVNSFETAADLAMIRTHLAEATQVTEGATDGKHALRVEFHPGDWPNVMLVAPKPWDWRGEGALAIDIANPGAEAIHIGVRVDDDTSADGVRHCRQGGTDLKPGERVTVAMEFGIDPMSVGMRGLPVKTRGEVRALGGVGTLDLAHIVQFQVFLDHPSRSRTLVIDNCRLIPWQTSLDRIVDRFGQYTGADWPGKLHSEADFATRRAAEEADLAATPRLPDRDAYGGWAHGPALRATGFFRTERVDGKWWLVDPDGRLFFSMGIDCVNTNEATMTTGRERMFQWLPAAGDPLARYAGHVTGVHSGPVKEGDTYNFLAANLERKYGRDGQKVFLALALRRLPSWGFNTIGNWSDASLYRNGKAPYVATAGVYGNHARLSSGSDYWGKMHDPFDPAFARSVADSLRGVIAQVKGDPWCLGYFVDNELSWGGAGEDGGRYGLGIGALVSAGGQPAKRALIEQLRKRYGSIAALNAAWKTTFADWAALDAPYHAPASMPQEMKADLAAFVKELARVYFRTIRDELRRRDPDHLYLGCRFAWSTPDAIDAAAEYCDVVSFNIYAPRLDPTRWAHLAKLGKPCIIGEFHFGALDRGMFHTGLVSTRSQAERAAMYVDYLHSVLDHPAFVGCHWFQYVDEPLTGRWFDGENYNIGFLTVTDTPYPEMVAAARKVHAEAYERRFGRSAGQ